MNLSKISLQIFLENPGNEKFAKFTGIGNGNSWEFNPNSGLMQSSLDMKSFGTPRCLDWKSYACDRSKFSGNKKTNFLEKSWPVFCDPTITFYVIHLEKVHWLQLFQKSELFSRKLSSIFVSIQDIPSNFHNSNSILETLQYFIQDWTYMDVIGQENIE